MLLDKYIWINSTPEQKVVLVTVLLMANHESYKWVWKKKNYEVQPGQFITSINSLVEKCGKGVSVQNVRTALKKFETHGFLTVQSTNENSLVTITNWGEYQNKDVILTNELTGDQQAPNKPLTTNNNDNNDNKNNKKVKNVEKVKNIIKKEPINPISDLRDKFELSLDWAGLLNDWLEYKKAKGQTYKSDRSIKSFITKLRNLSNSDWFIAKQIVEESMANNWAGIFKLKNNENNGDNKITAKERQRQQVAVDVGQGFLQRLYDEQNQ